MDQLNHLSKIQEQKWIIGEQFVEGLPDREASLEAQTVKTPPAAQGTQVPSLGREDPLEEGMATHSSILVWRVPWTEEPGGLQSGGHKESGATERLLQQHLTGGSLWQTWETASVLWTFHQQSCVAAERNLSQL